MVDDLPTMRCPQCKAEHPDFDGFGFVAHTKPAYPDGCGWCSHPSRDDDGKGGWVCGICGDVEVAANQETAAAIEQAWALAEADARSGAELQALTGDLEHVQDEYETRFAETLVGIAAAKESN